ncbi:MAG TPA: hypothetical protein VGL53_10020 [Bryobacteraceae bacterium]|jgi:hypothetical protein
MIPRLIPVLALAAALAGCTHPGPSKGVFIDPALMSLVPPDAKLLVGANLESLRKSTIFQDHFAGEFAAQLDNFTRQTGLDPRKDIWELLATSDGKSTVVMARGKFSVPDLEPQFDQRGAKKIKYKSYTLYGDETNTGVFMNSSTALAGNTVAVKAILDRRDQAAAPPADLVRLTDEVPHGSQLWAVFEGNFIRLPFEEGSNLGNVNRIIAGLESGMFYANMASGLDFTAVGNGVDEKNATSINDAMRALLGLLRLNTRNDQKELFEIYDSIDVKQTGKMVKLTAHIRQDLVNQLLKSVIFNGAMGGPQRHRPAPPPTPPTGASGATSSRE